MLTVIAILVVIALVCTILAFAVGKPPLAVAVLLLCIVELLRVVPLGR